MFDLFHRRPRPIQTKPDVASVKVNPLIQTKLDLISFAVHRLGVQTFADLGGVWGVEAGYTFYALDLGTTSGVLVDMAQTDTVVSVARTYPQLRVIRGDFGTEAIAAEVGQVDAVFLFDTLLHQVAANWDQILEMYSRHARCLLIYNQQWMGPGRRVRLLELGEDAYFRNVPHTRTEGPYEGLFAKLDTAHPRYTNRKWRDVPDIWQWGITDADLLEKAQDLGYSLQFFVNDGNFGSLPNFQNHAFLFSR
jgi:hypothetical protein